jgi:hypothetical protein
LLQCAVDIVQVLARLVEQSSELRPLERDGLTLRVVLVVGRRRLRRRDKAVEVTRQRREPLRGVEPIRR